MSVGLWSLGFGFLKEMFFLGKPHPEIRWPSPVPFYKHSFPGRRPFLGGPGLDGWGPMDAGALRAVLRAQVGLLLGGSGGVP